MKFTVNEPADVDAEKERIIKYSDVKGYVEESLNTYSDVYLKNAGELINRELSQGLDPYSLCICGDSPAYKKGQIIKNKIDAVKPSVEGIKEKISSATYAQRVKELGELLSKTTEAKERAKAELTRVNELQAALNQQWAVYDQAIQQYPPSTGFTLTPSPVHVTKPFLQRDGYSSNISRIKEKIEQFILKEGELNTDISSSNGKV